MSRYSRKKQLKKDDFFNVFFRLSVGNGASDTALLMTYCPLCTCEEVKHMTDM